MVRILWRESLTTLRSLSSQRSGKTGFRIAGSSQNKLILGHIRANKLIAKVLSPCQIQAKLGLGTEVINIVQSKESIA